MKAYLEKLLNKKNLNFQEAELLMDHITSGDASTIYISAILTALRMKGESIDEISGFASIMRQKAARVNTPKNTRILDIVGTGGDGHHTFNISTISAIITAAAGATVAKHGNRSISSKCGSADVLEALGVNLNIDNKKMEKVLENIGLVFMFAPIMHGSMKHVMPVRKELGVRTVFNMLGPLTNPAFADCMIIGVYEPELTEVYAKVLQRMGVECAAVLCGHGEADELTLSGPNKITYLSDKGIESKMIDFADYGFARYSMDDIKGGSVYENKTILMEILNCDDGAYRDTAIINAAMALSLYFDIDLEEAIQKAKSTINSGKALETLQKLIKETNK